MSGFPLIGDSIPGVTSRRASRQQCRLAQAPTSKHQAPKKSRNRNTKIQAPNTREAPSSKFQARSAGRGLELGTWDFFGVWSLVFGVSVPGSAFFGAENAMAMVQQILHR